MATKVNKGTNYLLNKDDVGKSKPTTRDLPHDNHSYGKPDIKDPEGVAEGTTIIQSPAAGSSTCNPKSQSQMSTSRNSTRSASPTKPLLPKTTTNSRRHIRLKWRKRKLSSKSQRYCHLRSSPTACP
jgi:hypothetical protein